MGTTLGTKAVQVLSYPQEKTKTDSYSCSAVTLTGLDTQAFVTRKPLIFKVKSYLSTEVGLLYYYY